ncbi:hypothetical protein NP233_g12262 [Leucocoprinus birnbaumii]|uniref:DUF6533 domain-containing protein n=1 Tax=Leucocoprinus birnbaumii TaxID=56174 RepID=A0AAD5VF41_9AGAR|nr:hypothetical protein NP233_g12262 [Leucocoprinus birnbaumii]
MAVPPELQSVIDTVADAIQHAQNINYAQVTSQAIIIFDWLLTLDLEISMMWASSWNLVKVVYLLARYLPFVLMILVLTHGFGYYLSTESCARVYDALTMSVVVVYHLTTIACEVLLTLRSWAIMGKGKKLGYFLFGWLAAVYVIADIVGEIFYLKNSIHLASPVPPLGGCLVTGARPFVIQIFACAVVYESVLVSLLIARGVKLYRSDEEISQLWWVAYRDGILYYIYLFALSLINLIVMVSLDEDYVLFLVIVEVAIHSQMAQNQPYTQYPYYTQPQNIYQQLGKPQPQPHLQNVYQQHQQQPQQQLVHVPQQQYQYPYQHTQQQPQQQPQIQRAPSAHGFQPPQTPFPNASGYAPQQQQIAAPQQQMYQYSQQAPAPAPVPQAPAMYQRPPSQNSRLPTSSFANLASGQSIPDALARQLGQLAQNQPNNVNPSTGQLVPASQSLTLRGPSPAISPGPPISPSAVYAQQAQQQNYQQQPFQQSPQPLQGQQNLQQIPSTMSLVPANRNSVVLPPQRQIMPPSQPQTQAQTQPQVQTQAPHQIQSRNPPPLPPRQLHQPQLQSRDQQQLPQSQSQAGPVTPTKTTTPRRPLPTPGAPRSFPTVNTNNSALVSPPSSSVSNISPTRSNQRLSLTTTDQPNSPTKTGPSSPTKASSPNQPNRPLPTPGGGSGGISGIGAGSGGNGLAREGFAGIGTKSSSSRVTGLPVDPSVTSLVAGIQPHKLAILPLPDGSSPPQEEETTPTKKPIQTGLPNPPSMIQAGPSTSAEGSNSITKRRAASPPRFQPGPSTSPSSGPSSPKKELSPLPSSAHKPSPTASTASGQSSSNQPQSTDSSPTKKSAPVWKRTIPDYPQPAFGYAAGMVKDPWTKSPTSSSPGSTPSQKQSPGQAKPPTSSKPSTSSAPSQAPVKPTKAEIDRQRALVERQHVERQLNAAMAQAYTQAKTRQQVSGMDLLAL